MTSKRELVEQMLLFYLSARIFNLQSPGRAHVIARRHYDLGNDLFFAFLDRHNQYSFQEAWSGLSERYDRTFKSMREYYLLSCAGSFCARQIQVWQIVMTKVGMGQPPCRYG